MRKFVRYLTLVFLVLVFFTGLVFALSNTSTVGLAFGPWQLPAMPVSVWIVAAFVTGGLLGLAIGMGLVRNLRARAEIHRLKKQLDKTEQELTRVRAVSHPDTALTSRDLRKTGK